MNHITPGLPVHHQLLDPTQTHVHWVSDAVAERSQSWHLVDTVRLAFHWFCYSNHTQGPASENPAPLPVQVPFFRTLSTCRWQERGNWSISCHISKPGCHSHQQFQPSKCQFLSLEGAQEGGQYLPSSSYQACSHSLRGALKNQVRCRIQDAWGWCTGMTQRDGMGRVVGGGFRMGSTCTPTPMVDSCWCMAKPIQYCKVITLQLK